MLATLSDLVAIGAVPDGTNQLEKYGVRGTRLLELASAQVCAYLGTTEVDLLAAITAEQATALAAIVAEAAGSRLNVSAAPSTDPYAVSGAPSSVMLNRWHFAQIDRLLGRPGQGNASLTVTRDTDSSWLTSPGVSTDAYTGDGPGWRTIGVYPT